MANSSWRKFFWYKWRFELSITCLLLLTLAALTLFPRVLERTLIIEPEAYQFIYTNDDRYSGGTSVAQIVNREGYAWRCELKKTFRHPYCGFEIVLGKNQNEGVDLSNYSKIKLWLNYSGPTEAIRLYLRNINPAYFREGVYDSTKYNQLEFHSSLIKNGYVEFSMDNFSVAEWWLNSNKVPPNLSHVQLENTILFEVSSGTYSVEGVHDFELTRVELQGHYLSTEHWYLSIIIFWLIIIFGYLLYRALQLSQRVRAQLIREKQLVEINTILDSQSRRLDLKSKTDHLTGVFNRRGLEESLQLVLNERRDNQTPIALIMFDLDHFKSINDTYGHLMGDEVLIKVAQLVQQQIRHNDIFARWGGEEFVIVCKDATARQAEILAEKIREYISNYHFDNDLNITASFGVADISSNESLESLFVNADLALYQAKNNGRNKVESYK
jgi:diguanylate cyclase (GGDEF)-like protein